MDDGEDEEYGPESDRSRARKSEDESEIHMSLCLNAFQSLEPKTNGEMQQIFNEYKIDYAKMNDDPVTIMKDPNLVVQIEHNFYTWQTAAPIIMSYLAFKQPLNLDSANGLVSLNEQILGEQNNKIDNLFEIEDGDLEDLNNQNDEFYFNNLNYEELGVAIEEEVEG